MTLNEKLVYLRKNKGLSQLNLAERLNVSRQAISRWEVGTSTPSMENLLSLSELYEIPVDVLLNVSEKIDNINVGKIETHNAKKKIVPIIFFVVTLCLVIVMVFYEYFAGGCKNEIKEEIIGIDSMNKEEVLIATEEGPLT